MSRATVMLFKPSGKYYCKETWEIPVGAIGPWDMERSRDFRRIMGGAVLVIAQEPWGCPHLFPGSSMIIENPSNDMRYPAEPQREGWYVCPSVSCRCVFYKFEDKWKRSLAGMELRTRTWQQLCETEADCVGRGLIYLPDAIRQIKDKFDGGTVE